MYRKEYDIFISYRRESGEDKARILNQYLSAAGYRVFFDHEAGMTGEFETEILAAVEIAPIFLMLMTPHCFDRCVNEGDWVSREVELAVKLNKHIVPIRPNYNFDFNVVKAGIPEHVMRLKDLEFGEIDFHKNFKATAQSVVDTMIKTVVQPSLVIKDEATTGAVIHFFSDISCRVLHYGTPIAVTDAADTTDGAVVRLLKGRHKLEYKSIEHEEDAYSEVYMVADNDYEDFVDISLQPIKDKRKEKEEELRAAEEQMAAHEKERRTLENVNANSSDKQYKYDFFLSYSSKDAAIVRNVQYFLENSGYSCCILPDCLVFGIEYDDQVINSIEQSKAFIFFYSENANESRWQYEELRLARRHHKRILPILLDRSLICERLVNFLIGYQYFDLTNRENMIKLARVARQYLTE